MIIITYNLLIKVKLISSFCYHIEAMYNLYDHYTVNKIPWGIKDYF